MHQSSTEPTSLPESIPLRPVDLTSEEEDRRFQDTIYQQKRACFSALLTMFTVGTVYGWSTTSLRRLTSGADDVPLKIGQYEYSWLISLTVPGSIIGAFMCAYLADRIGRKNCLLVCSAMITAGWLIIYGATSVRVLYLARVIQGIGIGIARTINPMYVSEVADISIRGMLGSLITLMTYAGIMITCSLVYWPTYELLLVILTIISFISFLLNTCFPETPYFLVAKGRMKRACKSLAYYKGILDPDEAKIELRELRAQTRYELHPQTRYEIHPQSRYELGQQSRSDLPSQSRTHLPSQSRTNLPSQPRTNLPSQSRTDLPSQSRTDLPSQSRTDLPSQSRTDLPSQSRTDLPSQSRTDLPSQSRTDLPSQSRTDLPSQSRTDLPSQSRTDLPSQSRTDLPSQPRTDLPSQSRTDLPSQSRTDLPSQSRTDLPSQSRTDLPSQSRTDLPSTSRRDSRSPSRSDLPSTSGSALPSTSRIDLPSESRSDLPSTSRIDLPSESRSDLPSTSRRDSRSPSRSDLPSTSGSALPSTSRIDLPSESRSDLPSTSRIDLPSESRSDLPLTSRRDSRSPSRSDLPSTSGCDLPSTSRNDLPSTSRNDLPSTSRNDLPSQSRTDLPSQCRTDLPSQSRTDLPSQSRSNLSRQSIHERLSDPIQEVDTEPRTDLPSQSRSNLSRQSIHERLSDPTQEVDTEPMADLHLPSSSNLPSTSEIHSEVVRDVHEQPTGELRIQSSRTLYLESRSELHRSSTSNLRRQSTVDSRTWADEIHMDGTKYTWFTKLQVILKRSNKKALSLMFGLIIAHQLGQHYMTMQYPEKFYRKINIVSDSYTAMFMVQLINFLSSCYTVFRVDTDGRRKLLLLSTCGAGLTLTTIAFYLFMGEDKLQGFVFNYIIVIILIVYQVMFQVGLGTIPTLLICELFPAELKGFVGAIIVLFEGIIGYMASIWHQAILNIANASAVYHMFATSCSLAFMMVYLQIPETKGKTYNEVEELLVGKNLNSSNEDVRSDESDIYRL